MNNWMGVSYWVFMAAMLRLSYEVEASQNGSGEDQGNYTPIGDSNPFAGHSDGADERMKRFLSFSPEAQERAILYLENLHRYLKEGD